MICPLDWCGWMQRRRDLESNLIVNLDKKFNESEEGVSVVVDKVKTSFINNVPDRSLGDTSVGFSVELLIYFVREDSLPV